MTKVNYKNWVPKSLLYLLRGMAIFLCLALLIVFLSLEDSLIKTVLSILLLVAAVGMGLFWAFMFRLHRALAYDGNRKLARDIIQGLAAYVDLPPGGVALENKTPYLIHFNGIAA